VLKRGSFNLIVLFSREILFEQILCQYQREKPYQLIFKHD